jgi:flagellar export protein FliJ
MEEDWAKNTYLDLRSDRIEHEAGIASIQERRAEVLINSPATIEGRLAQERVNRHLDDEETEAHAALSVIVQEEERALNVWHERKRAVELLARLRDREYEAWRLDEARKEQAELDEWAVLRRAA